MNPIKAYLNNIKALILDFDGVLTDNNGTLIRMELNQSSAVVLMVLE